jgi:dihydroorotate dehydrogenase (NAD+) catalytic subunit
MKHKFLGKEISGIFTIPSGIITTSAKIIEKVANEIPEVGVITTKSIGLGPREGNREPIITQYAQGCFMNAVGLTNPGAEEFAEHLKKIKIPEGKFILTSIFGKDAEEFVKVAKILAPYSDGLELNLSCPHASGYGMAIGQDPKLVKSITAAVKKAVDIPVIPKLTPNISHVAGIAKAAVEGGADAICAINTVGPGYHTVEGNPVLTNKKGGMSGKGILPIGLRCIKEISEAVSVPLIGCGGMSDADDVRAYKKAGATIVGVGSALVGLSSEELKKYFSALSNDLKKGTNNAAKLLKKNIDMSFKKYRLVENKKLANDFSLLVFDGIISIKPGQFVFAWIPGAAEKPFSVLDNNPLTLAILKTGCFTEKLVGLEKGAEVYFRGPYGVPVEIKGSKIILVGGGTGLAALYQIAKDFNVEEVFIGARDKNHLFYVDKMKKHARVNVTTDDGSEGYKGFVTELLKERLNELQKGETLVFFNCGPENMIDAALAIEKKYTSLDKIFNSIDYITKCGVGLCGSCIAKDGRRLCVDGPFMGEKNEN